MAFDYDEVYNSEFEAYFSLTIIFLTAPLGLLPFIATFYQFRTRLGFARYCCNYCECLTNCLESDFVSNFSLRSFCCCCCCCLSSRSERNNNNNSNSSSKNKKSNSQQRAHTAVSRTASNERDGDNFRSRQSFYSQNTRSNLTSTHQSARSVASNSADATVSQVPQESTPDARDARDAQDARDAGTTVTPATQHSNEPSVEFADDSVNISAAPQNANISNYNATNINNNVSNNNLDKSRHSISTVSQLSVNPTQSRLAMNSIRETSVASAASGAFVASPPVMTATSTLRTVGTDSSPNAQSSEISAVSNINSFGSRRTGGVSDDTGSRAATVRSRSASSRRNRTQRRGMSSNSNTLRSRGGRGAGTGAGARGKNAGNKEIDKIDLSIIYIVLSALLFGLVYLFGVLFNNVLEIFAGVETSCMFRVWPGVAIAFQRLFIILFYIQRYYVAFKDVPGKNLKVTSTCNTVYVVCVTITILGSCVAYYIILVTLPGGCDSDANKALGTLPGGFFDIFWSVWIASVFVYKLHQIRKNTSHDSKNYEKAKQKLAASRRNVLEIASVPAQAKDKIKRKKLLRKNFTVYYAMTKLTYIFTLSVSLTILSYLGLLVTGSVSAFVCIDISLRNINVLLTFSFADRIYQSICCLCLRYQVWRLEDPTGINYASQNKINFIVREYYRKERHSSVSLNVRDEATEASATNNNSFNTNTNTNPDLPQVPNVSNPSNASNASDNPISPESVRNSASKNTQITKNSAHVANNVSLGQDSELQARRLSFEPSLQTSSQIGPMKSFVYARPTREHRVVPSMDTFTPDVHVIAQGSDAFGRYSMQPVLEIVQHVSEINEHTDSGEDRHDRERTPDSKDSKDSKVSKVLRELELEHSMDSVGTAGTNGPDAREAPDTADEADDADDAKNAKSDVKHELNHRKKLKLGLGQERESVIDENTLGLEVLAATVTELDSIAIGKVGGVKEMGAKAMSMESYEQRALEALDTMDTLSEENNKK